MKAVAAKESRWVAKPKRAVRSGPALVASGTEVQRKQLNQILSSTGAQAKLTIGQPNDAYEQEADRVADHVVAGREAPVISSISSSGSASSVALMADEKAASAKQGNADEGPLPETQEEREEDSSLYLLQPAMAADAGDEEGGEPVQARLIQRQVEEEDEPVQTKLIQRQVEDEEEPVQAKLIQNQSEEKEEEPLQAKLIQREADQDEEDQVQAKAAALTTKSASDAVAGKSGGRPMRADVRSQIEASLGTDLSDVQVHEDGRAHQAAKSISARAFTHGKHIWLGRGESQSNLHLMAHESTHVLQQGGVARRAPNNIVQRLQDTSTDGGDTGVVISEEDKAKALAAAEAAERLARGTVVKSTQQVGESKIKKEEKNKERDAALEEKKKAEQGMPAENTRQDEASGGGEGTNQSTEETKPQAEAEKSDKPPSGNKNEKAPNSAQGDVAFQSVVAGVKKTAEDQKQHKPADDEAKAAQNASEPPASEVESKAQSNQVEAMEKADTPAFDAKAFKAKLMERIEATAPKTTEEADDFKKSNKAGAIKGEMAGQVTEQKNNSQAPMQDAASVSPDAGGIEPKTVTPLELSQPGPPPAGINTESAVPKAKGESEVETPIRKNTQQIGNQMDEAGITDEQLAKSNEPEFVSALAGKKNAEADANEAPGLYRQFESVNHDEAQAASASVATDAMASMHASRSAASEQLTTNQEQTKSEDAKAREKVAADIQGIYDTTKVETERILAKLDEDVSTAFDRGAEAAKLVFENYVDAKMNAYKEKRYGGWLGWARWLKDKVVGMPSEVNAFFSAGRKQYLKEMDAVIDNVVAIVGKGLTSAKAKIAEGKKQIQEYVNGLPDNLKDVGKKAAADIQDKFTALEQNVDDKQNQLITDLATKYNESLKAVDARIDEMKAANQGLVGMVVGLLKGIIETIKKLVAMLTSLLAKIANVIGDIISDPIGFLGNLIKGVKKGFDKFVSNIMSHLISGLVKWLTGALGPMGITIPENLFSLKGIFSLVMQVLGLTWDYFRTKAVKLLGEPVVKALETGFEIFMIVKEKGIAGLWEYIKEQFSNLKEMVIDEIKSMIVTQVITAGVKWIIGLLNPVGAFVKAAMAIYEIVKFFIERAAQIYEFVNSVVDSIADIVKGNIEGAAQRVETALANTIPLIIGFLASLLGISGLAKKVQKVIGKVRKKIDKAIDKILMKAKKFAKKLIGKGKAVVGNIAEWWKKRKPFKTKGGEKHEVYFTGSEKNPVPMVASKNPKPVSKKVEEFERIAKSADSTDKQKAMLGRLAETKLLAIENPDSEVIVSNFKEFFDVFAEGRGLDSRATEIKRVTGTLGGSVVGTKMTAEWLGPDHIQGGPPEGGVQSKLMGRLYTEPSAPNQSKYIRGHLLNDNLGGKGKDFNLFPITANANKEHLNRIEKQVKKWVNDERRWVYYQVEVQGISSSFASTEDVRKNYVNAVLSCRAAIRDPNDDKYKSNGITAVITSKYNAIETTAKPRPTGEAEPELPEVSQEAKDMAVLESSSKKKAIYLDELAAQKEVSSFLMLGYNEDDAKKLIGARPEGKGYRKRSDIPSDLDKPWSNYLYRRAQDTTQR